MGARRQVSQNRRRREHQPILGPSAHDQLLEAAAMTGWDGLRRHLSRTCVGRRPLYGVPPYLRSVRAVLIGQLVLIARMSHSQAMDNPWWRKRHLGPHTVRVRVALDEFESLPFDEVVSLVDWFETHPVAPERLTPELLADAPLLRVFATIQDSLRDIWGRNAWEAGGPLSYGTQDNTVIPPTRGWSSLHVAAYLWVRAIATEGVEPDDDLTRMSDGWRRAREAVSSSEPEVVPRGSRTAGLRTLDPGQLAVSRP
jgi:hypothetical protein